LDQSPGEIRLLSMASGNTAATLAGFRGKADRLAFSPDNKLLVSGMDDTSALVWRLAPAAEQPAADLEPKVVRRLWDELAGEDAAKAYRAMWMLARSPSTSIPFLQANLQPAVAPDASTLAKLIKDMNSDRFVVRDQATRALEQLGELAEASLKQALDANPPLEARQRIQRLLGNQDAPIKLPAKLRQIRAVEVLEYIGTPAAARLLERLTRGAPAARLTHEARDSLARISTRAR
jgi:hypothetical protein